MKSQYLIVLLALVFGISKASAQTIVVPADSPSAEYSSKLTKTLQFIELENGDGYSLSYKRENEYIPISHVKEDPSKYNLSDLFKDLKNEKGSKVMEFALNKKDAADSSFFTIQFAVPKADDLSKLPFPSFSQNIDSEFESYKRNRHLIIDANPNPRARLNTQLFKSKKQEGGTEGKSNAIGVNISEKNLVVAHSIPKNGSIAVFIKNYNFWNIEEISISMNEEDFTYNKGLVDVRNLVIDDKDSSEINEEKVGTAGEEDGDDNQKDKSAEDPFQEYLENVYKNWGGIKYLNFNDLQQVEYFKENLTDSINKIKKALTPDQQEAYSKILSWYPEYVSLTDIPLSSVDADEVNFKLKIKNENETTETEYDLRTYRIVGGLSFNISSTLFLTGLVNGSVYADSVEIEGVKELRAKIDDTNNKFTAGIGVNTEITYRSGWMVNPTASIGFFVPFDEDITPNIALGGGLSVITKRVRLSLTGGLAIGQVNAIEDRYVDRNLADFPNLINENLSTKSWDKAWQLGIGLSYKLKE